MKISKSLITLGVVVIVALMLLSGGCSKYNSLITQEENVNTAWSQVETQCQRRLDLIPNLVSTVKGYADYEGETYTKVAQARAGLSDAYNQAQAAGSDDAPASEADARAFADAQQKLKSALSLYINAVHEAYPDLKASENFRDLMTQLEGTENRIATERTRYNNAVKDYNLSVRRFPGNIVASICGFSAKAPFQADEQAMKAPAVQF